jgi:hypothetical protein
MAQPNTWEHALESLMEATSRLLACDSSGQAGIEGLVALRAAAVEELTALPDPCPAHLASALQKVCDDGDQVCLKLKSSKMEMQSELTGLLQIRSMLSTNLDSFPSLIDFTA